jgi:hypothetical protein
MVGKAYSISDGFDGDGGEDSNLTMLAESQVFQSTELLDESTRQLPGWYVGGKSVTAPELWVKEDWLPAP